MVRLTKSFEDYLESIYILEKNTGHVRVKQIAENLNVRLPSVTEAVRKLSKLGLVDYERYGLIKLTFKGKKFAKEVYAKHEVLLKFLIEVLRVDKITALRDACTMEHGLSNITLKKLTKFMKTRRR